MPVLPPEGWPRSTTRTTSTSWPTSPAPQRRIDPDEATGGNPSRSPRWHANIRSAATRSSSPHCGRRRATSGRARALPRTAAPMFDRRRVAFVRAIAAAAEGARRRCCSARPPTPRGRTRPAWSCSPPTGRSSRRPPASSAGCQTSPTATGMPAAALGGAGGRRASPRSAKDATARRGRRGRVLTRSGCGSSCTARRRERRRRPIAVIVEPAHPARIAPLLMSAYGLTDASRTSPASSSRATRPPDRRGLACRPRRSSSTSRACSTRPACTAAATSWQALLLPLRTTGARQRVARAAAETAPRGADAG